MSIAVQANQQSEAPLEKRGQFSPLATKQNNSNFPGKICIFYELGAAVEKSLWLRIPVTRINGTYMDIFRNKESKNSLYIAQLMNLLSLNSDGAFLTTKHSLIPHKSSSNSPAK